MRRIGWNPEWLEDGISLDEELYELRKRGDREAIKDLAWQAYLDKRYMVAIDAASLVDDDESRERGLHAADELLKQAAAEGFKSIDKLERLLNGLQCLGGTEQIQRLGKLAEEQGRFAVALRCLFMASDFKGRSPNNIDRAIPALLEKAVECGDYCTAADGYQALFKRGRVSEIAKIAFDAGHYFAAGYCARLIYDRALLRRCLAKMCLSIAAEPGGLWKLDHLARGMCDLECERIVKAAQQIVAILASVKN